MRDAGWNGSVSPGKSVTFGFNGNYTGTNDVPAAFTVNGSPCGNSGASTNSGSSATTTSPGTTGGVVAPPPPTTSTACSVSYVTSSDWGTGFVTNITVSNKGTSAINGWTLAWQFAGNQTITSAWNGVASQSGKSAQIRNAAYNAAIPAGASTQFGFQGVYTGSNGAPVSFTLNGLNCN